MSARPNTANDDMKYKFVMIAGFTLFALLEVGPLYAQEWVLEASPDTEIPTTGAYSLVEPHVAVDPADARHIVVAAITLSSDRSRSWPDRLGCLALVSMDRGATWSEHLFPVSGCGDPWILFLSSQEIAIAMLAEAPGVRRGLLIFRSKDGGRSWDRDPASRPGSADHPTLAVLSPSSEPPRSFLVASVGRSGGPTIYLNRLSIEMGGQEQVRHLRPSTFNHSVTNPVVLRDGTVFVGYKEFATMNPHRWLEAPRTYVLQVANADGFVPDTAVEPIFVTDQCGSRSGFQRLAADVSEGSFDRRLYLFCTGGLRERMLLFNSEDGGASWSRPLQVDLGSSGNPPYVRTPGLAVNKNGVVGLTWYDRREDPARQCQYVYFTVSVDGGRSVERPVRLSDKASCPESARDAEAGRRWAGGGDYGAINGTSEGTFRIVWADARSGLHKLHTAEVHLRH